MRKLFASIAAMVAVGGALVLAGCPDEGGGLSYICENGTPTAGNGAIPGVSNCRACNQGSVVIGTLGEVGSECWYRFVCDNGTATTTGSGTALGASSCDSCNEDYKISGIAGTEGSTCSEICFLVYGDDTIRTRDCDQLELANDVFGVNSDGGGTLTFMEMPSGGHASSAFRRLNLTFGDSGRSAIAYISLARDFNAAGRILNFSIKSDQGNGGNNRIRIYLEADPGGSSDYQTLETEGTQMFTNDGTWQEVSIDLATAFSGSFAATGTGAGSRITAANIRTIGFALLDVNGLSLPGLGNQRIDIDEIRFE